MRALGFSASGGSIQPTVVMITLEMKSCLDPKKILLFSTFWFIALSIFTAIPSSTPAQDNPQVPGKLLVGVADFPPYAMKTEDGKWEGVSIELWQVAAKELGIEYGLKEFSRLGQVIEALQKEGLDVTPAMAVTEYNEIVMDLSHSYHRSGLAIAVPQNSPGRGWIGFIKRFASRDTLKVVVLLLLLSLLAGAMVWLLENKKNREMFGGKLSQGIGHSIWWALVTMTTVGYGDKAPRTLGGRVVAVIWMFFSIILVTSYTAVITASFTVVELSGRVRSPRDLPAARVGALAQSETLEFLANEGIPVLPFKNLRQGLQAVAANNIDAFVDDEAQLKYIIKNEFQGKLRVLPETFAHYYVSMAIPSDSPLREPLNRVLAKIIDSDDWVKLKERYLGRNR